ncbi:MAG: NAD(P)H-binding protein [Kamptonema sp. SIO1D9]|nr:NAD(P)H-binding protein [Kamptonema sp. SIO1D9]
MTQQKFWDLGRFVRTLTYFDIIPVINNIDWLKNMILGEDIQQVQQNPKIKTGIILVAGATGGVGKRVVKRLQKYNYPVRALVRSIPRAKTILGENLEFYEADITIPDTLKPDLMQDVIAIICCTGTRVQPVGGDTPNRDKYYQGVKFYQPEIAESTPEAVEYKGIQNLVNLASQYLAKSDEKILFDFTQPTEDLKSSWGAVDDVVMGGVSESGIRLAGNVAIFSGNVSTENNGGFASVRNRNFQPPLDLSSYAGIELRVKGDGKRYKFIMRCENNWDGISYCYSFDTVKDEWITVRIPFKDLIAVFRAKTVPDAPAFAASKTYSVQLMLSKFEYDKGLNPTFEPGYFQLDVESIKAYKDESTPQFIMVSSAGVTRPGRPDINLEEEPPAVRMNDMLGGILTWKLKGEDAVRNSGLTYTIIRPCALTEEIGGKVLTFAEGDNIKGQVSREDIAELCVQAIEIPAACEKTFEVKEEAASGTIDWESLFREVSRDR